MKRKKVTDYEVVMWDWKEQADVDELSSLARKGYVYFKAVDTEGDFFAVICTKKPIRYPEADRLFRLYADGE